MFKVLQYILNDLLINQLEFFFFKVWFIELYFLLVNQILNFFIAGALLCIKMLKIPVSWY